MKPTKRRNFILSASGFLLSTAGCTQKVKTTQENEVEIESMEIKRSFDETELVLKGPGQNTKTDKNITIKYTNYYDYHDESQNTEWKFATKIKKYWNGRNHIPKKRLANQIPVETPVTFKFMVEDKSIVLDDNYYMFTHKINDELKFTDTHILEYKIEQESPHKKWFEIEENKIYKWEENNKIHYKAVGHIFNADIEPGKYDIKETFTQEKIGLAAPEYESKFYPFTLSFSIEKENKKDLEETISEDELDWTEYDKNVFINNNIGSIKYRERSTIKQIANQVSQLADKYKRVFDTKNGTYGTDQLDLRVLHGIWNSHIEYKRDIPIDNGTYSVLFPFQIFDVKVADCAAETFFIMSVAYHLGYDVSTHLYTINGVEQHVEPAALIESKDYYVDNDPDKKIELASDSVGTNADEHVTITTDIPVSSSYDYTEEGFDKTVVGMNYAEN